MPGETAATTAATCEAEAEAAASEQCYMGTDDGLIRDGAETSGTVSREKWEAAEIDVIAARVSGETVLREDRGGQVVRCTNRCDGVLLGRTMGEW